MQRQKQARFYTIRSYPQLSVNLPQFVDAIFRICPFESEFFILRTTFYPMKRTSTPAFQVESDRTTI